THHDDVVELVSRHILGGHSEDRRDLRGLDRELIEAALGEGLLATVIGPRRGNVAVPERDRDAGRTHLDLASERLNDRAPGHLLEDRSGLGDRKSTRLNSSHVSISYAVFCLKKIYVVSRDVTNDHIHSL